MTTDGGGPAFGGPANIAYTEVKKVHRRAQQCKIQTLLYNNTRWRCNAPERKFCVCGCVIPYRTVHDKVKIWFIIKDLKAMNQDCDIHLNGTVYNVYIM